MEKGVLACTAKLLTGLWLSGPEVQDSCTVVSVMSVTSNPSGAPGGPAAGRQAGRQADRQTGTCLVIPSLPLFQSSFLMSCRQPAGSCFYLVSRFAVSLFLISQCVFFFLGLIYLLGHLESIFFLTKNLLLILLLLLNQKNIYLGKFNLGPTSVLTHWSHTNRQQSARLFS